MVVEIDADLTAALNLEAPPHVFGEGGLGIPTAQQVFEILRRNIWPYLTPLIVIPALVGLFSFGRRSRHGMVFHYWLLATLTFICIAAPGNEKHEWYQLPLVPITAAFAARGVVFGLRKLDLISRPLYYHGGVALLLMIMLGCIAYYALRPYYAEWNPTCLEAAQRLRQIAPPEARVLIPDGGDPSCIYYTGRKGWHFWSPKTNVDAIKAVEQYRTLGAMYLIIDADHLWWLDYYKGFAAYLEENYRKIVDHGRYLIVDITRKTLKKDPAMVLP